MFHLSRSSYILIALGISIVPLYQNCSSNISFEKSSDFALTQGEAELVDFYISPSSWENRPKINITAIVDNSNSMAPLQEKMSQALTSAIDPLTEFSGDIQLFTTTVSANSDGGDKISTSTYYLDKNGNRTESLPSSRPYTKKFATSHSYTQNAVGDYEDLIYRPENFLEAKNLLSSSVRNLGTSGSSKEEGLCSLLRASKSRAQNSEGTFNTFLVVSNENDFSDLSSCLDREEYLSQEVPVSRTNLCATAEDIANHPTCMYKNDARLEQSKKLLRNLATFNYSESSYGIIEKDQFKPTLTTYYNSYRAYYSYKDKQKKNQIQFKANVYNDGLIVGTQDFSIDTATVSGSCTTTSTDICSSDSLAFIKSKSWYIGGKLASIDNSSCRQTCVNTLSSAKETNLDGKTYHIGTCSEASFDTENFCSDKASCSAKCEARALSSIVKSSTSYREMCNNKNISKVEFNNNLFSDLGISLAEYNSPSDLLVQIADSISGFASAKVDCAAGRRYHLLTVKNDNVSLQSSSIQSSRPGFFPTNLNANTCSSAVTNWSDLFAQKSLNLESLELSFCGNSSSDRQGQVVEYLSSYWSPDLEGVSCSISSYIRSKVPSYVPNSNIQCKTSSYSKNEDVSCNIGTQRMDLCGGATVVEKFKANCSSESQKIDFEKEYNLRCNSQIVGTYSITEEELQNQVLKHKIVPENNLTNVAEFFSNQFGENFYLANFVTPSESDPEYASCVAENSQAFSYGEKYALLSSEINQVMQAEHSSVDSICKASYAPALDHVVNSILKKVEFSYRLSLAPNESIYKVFLVDSQGRSTFVGPDQYVFSNGIIKFLNKALMSSNINSIRIQIWRDLLVAKAE